MSPTDTKGALAYIEAISRSGDLYWTERNVLETLVRHNAENIS